MWSVYVFIGIVAFFAIAVALWNRSQRSKGNTDELVAKPSVLNSGGGCCGKHENCEKMNVSPTPRNIEYFDDEELDKYKNKPSSEYLAHEIDEFREVFHSLLDNEKPKWIQSLHARNITVPKQLETEVSVILNPQ